MSNLQYFTWSQRTVVEAGPGCRTYAPLRMSTMGSTRPALLTDKTLRQVGVADLVEEIFEVQGSPRLVGVYDKISPEFTGAEVTECARWCRENAVDGLVAVGGGSVIDCSKGVKGMLGMKAMNFWDLAPLGGAMYTEPSAKPLGIPLIAFPTTAGTGAEVSYGTIVTHEDWDIKCGLSHPFMCPDYAFLDAELTLGLPPRVTAHTGFDALTHAVEGLATKQTNDMTDAYAIQSIKMIRKYLPVAVNDGKNILARHKMLVAANMAIISLGGLEIPVHNVAHGIGAVLHVPHGEANMVALPIVMGEYAEYYLPYSENLAYAFDLDPGMEPEEIVSGAVRAIRDLQEACGFKDAKLSHEIDGAMVEQLCMAIKTDQTAAALPLPEELIRRCVLASFQQVKSGT